ncbi:MAG: MaoC family dehydratase [Bryobacteraceae bacterium]
MPRIFKSLDELKPLAGQVAGSSDWLVISQDKIDRFADLTGDTQWIHTQPERARRETDFGNSISHGFLTLSMLSEMSRRAIEIQTDHKMRINYGLNRVRFVSPIPAGSRIRGHFTPQSVADNEVIWSVTVELEGAPKPALVAEWITRFY